MSKVSLSPYLFFTGNCKEAMEFYQSVFGGELHISEHQAPMTGVMHAEIKNGVIDLMGADGDRREPYRDNPISLTLGGDDIERITGLFDALAVGGTVTSPIKKESWGDMFGAVTDKFGMDWMVNVSGS